MTHTSHTQAPVPHPARLRHQPSPAARATGIVVAITAALAVVAIAFALPATRSQPHDVPIGAAGPQAAGGQLSAMLEQNAPGAFDVTFYPGRSALAQAIRNREIYGGIAAPAEPGGPATMLIATGASPAIAGLLTQLAQQIDRGTGMSVVIEDLAPPSPRDPRGAGLAASALPLTLAGLLPAIALVLAVPRRHGVQFGAAVLSAALSGITIAALLRFVFGSTTENFWGIAAGLTLGVAAAALFLLGMGALFGRTGLALGAVLALLIGNPLSGLTSAPELLPAGWGTLGQLLPQGATATLLRSAAFFGGAGASTAVAVLVCWAVGGTALLAAAAIRHRTLPAP
ncbi:MAG: ABC transporter permease [Actinomycetota bacterium]|nr:ABC transporter permease [Actinomycetota bacterium]